MTSQEIRQHFFDFFQSKGHAIVPSAPIVVKNDPTLMFTNAGMNQFKDIFLGEKQAEAPRVADTQKCLRVSGKHNDLEEVGKDTYHHTMFEMLGNWSFGDYFKKEAIDWAWELLTAVYGLDKSRLYATIFEGDEKDGLGEDAEAKQEWSRFLPEDRILPGDKKDNFWEMGDTGPCGPSSEIHIDLRSDEEREKVDGASLVNQDHPQVIEVWNLVFIQFNRKTDGSLEKLQQQHVDTGMGFERLCMALQGKTSNYDTDVFTPYLRAIESLSGEAYGEDAQKDIAFRVIADHVRAIAFTIADGQLPSNVGAGYVIRRILRRAVRYGYSYLALQEPFLHRLLPVWLEQYKELFPELEEQLAFVEKVVQEEENSFLRTLAQGLKRLDHFTADHEEGAALPGHFVFELYDTYGFPADLTRLIAEERGYTIDEQGFEAEMKAQKDRSRQATSIEAGDWVNIDSAGKVEFVGYDEWETTARVLKYRKVKQKKKDQYQVVLDRTPFYAESGGQIGDTGVLAFDDEQIKVIDTKKENELIVHFVDTLPAEVPAQVEARINRERRQFTAANHTATHLMHAALKAVLGDHVAQKGSYVGPDRLRFDFSHFEKMTEEELQAVERLVNEKIWANIPRQEERAVPMEEAIDRGATALFGEKYGDTVRVITFGADYSMELCGGTHVEATGQIGLFKIVSESAVAAGVRRIEAITSQAAYEFVNKQVGLLKQVVEITKNPKDIVKGVEHLAEENKQLQKQVDQLQAFQVNMRRNALKEVAEEVNGTQVIARTIDMNSADGLKTLAFGLKQELDSFALAVGANVNGKPLLTLMFSEDLTEKGLHAGHLIREVAQHIKGGGGGQPFYATAGGKDVNGLEEAVAAAKAAILAELNA